MNHTEYVFGDLTQGYSQYPDDFTRSIFTDAEYSLAANSQIVIHRDAALLYYNYYRKLSSNSNHYIGLSVCFNGVCFKDIHKLFGIFEHAIAEMAISGGIIEFADDGQVMAKAGVLFMAEEEVKRITKSLCISIDALDSKSFEKLPALNYGLDRRRITKFALKDVNSSLSQAFSTVSRIIIYKDENFNSTQLTGYAQKLASLNRRNEELSRQNSELHGMVSTLRNKQRNTRWVSLLSIVVIVLFLILYFKVINPSEVSKYQTNDFVYYGPIKNKRPDGEGVAFYPSDDADGRRYYIGHFVGGERQDSVAMLYYQNGDYFYGKMEGDKWDEGVYYSTSKKSHFEGTFVDNLPSDGIWYRHEEAYKIKNGRIKY